MSDEVVRPSPLTTVAGLAIAFTGIMQAVSGFQLLTLFDDFYYWYVTVWVWGLAISGLVATVSGFYYTRSSLVGMVVGTAAAAFIGLVGLGWVVYAVAHGVFTLISVCSSSMGVVAALLGVIAGPSTVRFWRARRALMRD